MTENLRVLLVEDSVTDAKLVVRELQKIGRPIDFERVEAPETMRTALETKSWDIVISDWSMPRFSAPAALAVLKATSLDLPFIIVSGTIGEETAVEAMRAGAQDYVVKDRLGRLVPVVERELNEHKERQARRRAEAALREVEGRFQRLTESGIIGIAIAEVHGKLLEANDAYLKMIGYSRPEISAGAVGWNQLTPVEYRHLDDRAAEQLRTSEVATPWETEMVRKDGTRISVLVGVAMLEDPKCITFAADLTEQRAAEAGRQAAEMDLKRSNEQLRQAQKMEAVGRLAGGVAHDFNNLLSVILSYSEINLAALNANDPMREDLVEVHKAAESAAALTRQLLLLSRRQIVESRVLDLHDLLLGMEKMLQRILGEDVSLALIAPNSPVRVKADASHLEQVVLNLVVNSRDAMPEGGRLTIETTTTVLDDDYVFGHLPMKAGSYVMLAVSDTGMGMDSETQSRIFEPFFTTKEKGKGTGLGLSTVFGIVQQSGGSIWVYSELGKGTTFKVYLPRVDADLDLPVEQEVPISLAGTETILLVEDQEQVRGVALNILRRHGYQVIPARHPGEALLLSEKHAGDIDLVLTDIVMPNMSGPELAQRLTAARPRLKVVFMSGYTDESVVRHGVLESGAAFIQKPLTLGLLLRKIRSVLDQGTAVA